MGASRLFLICLFTGALAVQVAGCATALEHGGTGQFVDDGALTERVRSAIASEAGPRTAMNVNVTTYRGNVQLSGFVDSDETAQRAGAIAQRVEGVRKVQNDLHAASARR